MVGAAGREAGRRHASRETYYEEASVAGESPDKSEQRKSSGETTRGERDPRLAVLREGETGSGGSVVAVADDGSEVKAGAEAGIRESESESDDAVKGAESDKTGKSGKSGESGDADKSDKGIQSSEDGQSSAGSGDGPKGDGAKGDGSEGEESAEPVDRRTAVFRTLKRDPAPEPEADDEDSDGPVDRPTAAFGVLRRKDGPRWARKADESEESGEPQEARESGDSGKAGEKGEGGDGSAVGTGVDQPTRVIKALPLPADDKPAANKPADDKPAAKAADKPADATAAKAADTAAAEPAEPADATAAKTADKAADKAADTTAAKAAAETAAKATASAAAKPAEKPGAPSAGEKTADAERPSERTSRFVPLRSDDAPAARPPARPAAPPALPDPERTAQQPLPESERTKQQPLPPAGQPAPLDLLAQLTNTPPPPETPLRTAMRRIKIWTPIAVLLLIVLGVVQAMRPLPDPSLTLAAESIYRFDGAKLSLPWPDQGQSAVEVEGVGSLGTSGAQKPVPIASVTKVMTAYVVLKSHPLKVSQKGPSIRIDAQADKEAGSEDESRVPVKEGQTYTERQMLEMLLIPSGNNIARLLARWEAGSEKAFVKKMNDAAKDLGMKNTVYTDPSGFVATTKSTASDQLKLARAVMQSEAFRAVVATPNVKIPGLKDTIYNNNNLLVKPGVIGIKTGSSTPAGGALMWGAEKTVDGKKQRILGVVLEQRAPGILQNSLDLVQENSYKLITAVQEGLTSATVVKKGEVVGHVDDGLGGTTPVVATKDLTAIGWGGLEVELKLTDGGKTVPHSAKAGTVVGELTVGSGPGQVKVPVALQNDLSEPSFGAKLTRIA
ncbi:D-alanyl-D-alanine carboxypeptidase [Streptomyces sparsogenes]|uniref:D-alanyl-D-alanine carboxypeptidase n=1 Tax=Streptomyces sparsogenes TaxID=67365 RepID=UPI00384C7E4D